MVERHDAHEVVDEAAVVLLEARAVVVARDLARVGVRGRGEGREGDAQERGEGEEGDETEDAQGSTLR
jgi:hypothetical protein